MSPPSFSAARERLHRFFTEELRRSGKEDRPPNEEEKRFIDKICHAFQDMTSDTWVAYPKSSWLRVSGSINVQAFLAEAGRLFGHATKTVDIKNIASPDDIWRYVKTTTTAIVPTVLMVSISVAELPDATSSVIEELSLRSVTIIHLEHKPGGNYPLEVEDVRAA